MSTEVATVNGSQVQAGFDSVDAMVALHRMAKPFTLSAIVPPEYRGDQGIASAMIALDMAIRMRVNPLAVMQNLYIVHGRPGWSSKFLISTFNTCGRFEPIRYEWFGEEGKDTWGCRAYTKSLKTGEVHSGPKVTIGTAKSEGWYAKNGSKWKSIPQLMLMYRAAAWMINTTAPELSMGLLTAEEASDIPPEIRTVAPAFEQAVEAMDDMKAADVTESEDAEFEPATEEESELPSFLA